MRQVWLSLVAAGGAASACSVPQPVTLDPSRDVHCYVLVSYMDRYADHSHVPADQKASIRSIREWYGARLKLRSATVARDLEGRLTDMTPILNEVKRQPGAHEPELMQCTERALRDATFRRPPGM
jgi:hypothetical protein